MSKGIKFHPQCAAYDYNAALPCNCKDLYERDAKALLGATKNDQEKLRMELLPTEALEEVAKVLTFGAKKYEDENWRKGMSYKRLIGAALRHLYSFIARRDLDEESGLSHLSHAVCCLLFLITYQKLNLGTDDRFKHEA